MLKGPWVVELDQADSLSRIALSITALIMLLAFLELPSGGAAPPRTSLVMRVTVGAGRAVAHSRRLNQMVEVELVWEDVDHRGARVYDVLLPLPIVVVQG